MFSYSGCKRGIAFMNRAPLHIQHRTTRRECCNLINLSSLSSCAFLFLYLQFCPYSASSLACTHAPMFIYLPIYIRGSFFRENFNEVYPIYRIETSNMKTLILENTIILLLSIQAIHERVSVFPLTLYSLSLVLLVV